MWGALAKGVGVAVIAVQPVDFSALDLWLCHARRASGMLGDIRDHGRLEDTSVMALLEEAGTLQAASELARDRLTGDLAATPQAVV